MYKVIKRYGHDRGYSTAFRNHHAPETHCSLLHGYSLAFTFTFQGLLLDHRNWLISFGEFGSIKELLAQHFDHKTWVTDDDPVLPLMRQLQEARAVDLIVHDRVGCEAFAEFVYRKVSPMINSNEEYKYRRVKLESVAVSEHEGNTVEYHGDYYLSGKKV